MSCSCRTVSLRTFFSGLAQVHRLDLSSQPLRQGWSRASLPRTQYLDTTTVRLIRSIHATTTAAQEATATINSSTESPLELSTRPSSTAETALAEGIIESTSVQKPKKKKQRWRDLDESQLVKLKEEQAVAREDAEKNRKKKNAARNFKTRQRKKKKAAAEKDANGTITEKSGIQTIRRKDGITISTRKKDDKAQTLSQGVDSSTSTGQGDTFPAEAAGQKTPQEKLPDWRVYKETLKEKFPDGWKPRKRLSPDALAGIRALNAEFPEIYTTAALSAKFEVDPEAIRRILKSKWQPSQEEEERRLERWQKRGAQIWETKAALGIKPPKKWREDGITRDPSWHAWRRKVAHREREWEEEEKKAYREQRAASLQSRVAGKVL